MFLNIMRTLRYIFLKLKKKHIHTYVCKYLAKIITYSGGSFSAQGFVGGTKLLKMGYSQLFQGWIEVKRKNRW